MSVWFSRHTKGFSLSPQDDDAVEIGEETRDALLSQASSEDRMIDADENGYPIVVDYPVQPKTYQSELAELNYNYQLDIDGYKQAYALVALADGPQEAAKQAAIRDLYTARKALHTANINSLKAKYAGSIPV